MRYHGSRGGAGVTRLPAGTTGRIGDDTMEPPGPAGRPDPWHGTTLRALLRPALTATVLAVLYYVLPFDRGADPHALGLLGLGLLGLSGVAVWQVRAILRSPHPVAQAVQALAVAVPLHLVLFAATYVLLSEHAQTAFTEPLTRTDALYFTVTVFATVGFGDISPVSELARAVVLGQMVANLLVVGVLLKVVTAAARLGRDRRPTPGTRPGAGSVDDPEPGRE